MKKQNGITLIALIITIVVLLILAVVAIGAVKDSDIIGHAENAATKYNIAAKEEEELLGNYIKEIENILPKTAAEIVARVNKEIQENPSKYAGTSDVVEAYTMALAVSVIENDLGFEIKDRQNTTYSVSGIDRLDEDDVEIEFVGENIVDITVVVIYNDVEYTLVINGYYDASNPYEGAIYGIRLK